MVEALAVGTPVIATRTGGVAEVVRHGENGLLVPSQDPAALAATLAGLAADRALLARLSRGARSSVWPDFSWERRGAHLSEVMGELLTAASSA